MGGYKYYIYLYNTRPTVPTRDHRWRCSVLSFNYDRNHAQRIHGAHVATPQGKLRDEAQHIARPLHGGELPVGAVATVAHGPGDEGTSGHRRPEGDGGEISITKTTFTDSDQRVWQCEGGELTGTGRKEGRK